jgi:hypothetical protein
MTEPHSNDPQSDRERPQSEPIPVVDTAPPLAPAEHGQSPWWSAPSGKPFSIPDFAHEFAARGLARLADILAWLFPGPAPVPVRVKARPPR